WRLEEGEVGGGKGGDEGCSRDRGFERRASGDFHSQGGADFDGAVERDTGGRAGNGPGARCAWAGKCRGAGAIELEFPAELLLSGEERGADGGGATARNGFGAGVGSRVPEPA